MEAEFRQLLWWWQGQGLWGPWGGGWLPVAAAASSSLSLYLSLSLSLTLSLSLKEVAIL
jgi:hypothetical protein